MHKGAMPPPPIDRRVKQKKKERKRKMFPWNKFIKEKNEKRTRVGNWSMPLHKLPLIKVSNVQENAVFRHKFWKISLPWEGETPVPHPLALAPPLTNPGCTTVTGIAKGTRGHAPAPLDWSKIFFSKEGGVGDWYMSLHITNPLIMPFNVQEISFSYTNFQKISLPWEGEKSLPHHPPSRSLRSLALAPVDRPGCTTVTGIAKMHKGPWSPLIGVK